MLTAATNAPGIKGKAISSIRHPAQTLLVAEMPAFWPYSWHHPKYNPSESGWLTFNDARNVVSFIDGHANYIKIYWNEGLDASGGWSFSMNYDPPAGYDYQWTGN